MENMIKNYIYQQKSQNINSKILCFVQKNKIKRKKNFIVLEIMKIYIYLNNISYSNSIKNRNYRINYFISYDFF